MSEMSRDRYPFGSTGKWMPHTASLLTVLARDAFGTPTSVEEIPLGARIEISTVETIEGGARALVEGIRGSIVWHDAMNVGAIVRWNGKDYTITQAFGRPDTDGRFHVLTIVGVLKRSEGGAA